MPNGLHLHDRLVEVDVRLDPKTLVVESLLLMHIFYQ